MKLLWTLAVISGGYYLVALAAALLWMRRRDAALGFTPPVSILKPVRGRDPRFYQSIRSHAEQRYPEYEILFGVSDPRDPAVADIERVQREFPALAIRLVHATTQAPNGKVATLADLAREARHAFLLVNDSDIRVEPDYLASVVAPLANERVGLVTCLYRATAERLPGRWEALGIATEFAPSVLVARLAGAGEFALGSTMVFRAAQLEAIGGFASLGEYLADDYQLGRRISELGYTVVLSKTVVETNLGGAGWAEVWRRQLRWSRTIRVSRTAGYFGYVITHATLWSLLAACGGYWRTALAVMAVRMAVGLVVGSLILGDRAVAPACYLIPLRDLWGFALWVAGWTGNTVDWRGFRLRLNRDGRITIVERVL